MRRRLALVAAAAVTAATVPFATPAAAAGYCFGYEGGWWQGPEGISAQGGVSCTEGHYRWVITTCLQYSPVNVSSTFASQVCDTYVFTSSSAFNTVGGPSVGKRCPLSGYWRVTVDAIVDEAPIEFPYVGTPHLVVQGCVV